MPRTTAAGEADCDACKAIAAHDRPTDLYTRAYIAGLHITSAGRAAGMAFCEAHQRALDVAIAKHIGNGVRGRR